MLFLVGLTRTSAQSTLQSTALKTLFDLTLPLTDVSSNDRETLASLFEHCDASTNILSPILDDAVSSAWNCTKVITEKSTDSVFSTADKLLADGCIADTRKFFLKHGGINFLSVPALSAADKATLKSCANGAKYGEALAVIVQRYTPCAVSYTNELAIFKKIVPESPTTDAQNANQVAVRNVCISMNSFESMNSLVSDFTSNTVAAFVNGMHVFSTRSDR